MEISCVWSVQSVVCASSVQWMMGNVVFGWYVTVCVVWKSMWWMSDLWWWVNRSSWPDLWHRPPPRSGFQTLLYNPGGRWSGGGTGGGTEGQVHVEVEWLWIEAKSAEQEARRRRRKLEPTRAVRTELEAHQGGAGTDLEPTSAERTDLEPTKAEQDGTGAHQGGADGPGAHQGGADGTGAHSRDWDLGKHRDTRDRQSIHGREH